MSIPSVNVRATVQIKSKFIILETKVKISDKIFKLYVEGVRFEIWFGSIYRTIQR